MAEGTPRQRILLVENEQATGLDESRLLAAAGYEVELETDGESAVERALSSRFDLVLMDLELGLGIDGGEAAKRIRELGGPPVLFLCSRSDSASLAKAGDSRAFGIAVKGAGDRIILSSVRMALGLASSMRGLVESEERWESLVRTAPDIILSIAQDRRVVFMNKPIEGRTFEHNLGKELGDIVVPEDREALGRKLDRVFDEGIAVHHHFRAIDPEGEVRRYEAYVGPARELGRVASATAVIRDVTAESRLAVGEPLGQEDKEAELRAAMATFDFAPIRELLDSFHAFTGIQVSLVTREGEFYASTPYTRACAAFHTVHPESRAVCLDVERRIDALLAKPGAVAFFDYRCANGLRDIAQPLLVEGVHWATLFFGQFLYDDDDVDEAAFAQRAMRLGWDPGDYLAAIREVPRYTRRKASELIAFFTSLGGIVTTIAYGAFKERILSRHNIATEAMLGESDKRYRLLAENVGDVIWTMDAATLRFTYVSPSIAALRGLTVEEALAETLESSMTPQSLAKARDTLTAALEGIARGDPAARHAITDVYEQPCKDGSTKWVEISTKPVFDDEGRVFEIAGVSRDATARVLADAELKKALVEKDRLYAELQHRVKNSLALIVSLLSLEAGAIEDDEARVPLEEAQVRVRSIGLLYEQLYRTRSVGDIELGPYLSEVARAVIESPLSPRGLRLEADCASFRLATDRAVPAGLLLYELAANSVKHAFPGRRGGKMRLSLAAQEGMIRLGFEDDGIGLPEGFDLGAGIGLGSLLISQLACQLGGSAESGPGLDGRGAGFIVRFPLTGS